MKNLRKLSKQEREDFFNSFDIVLADADGVLWNGPDNIPGTDDAIKSLRKIGKRVIFVSNNTTKTMETYSQQFRKAKIDVDIDDIVTPTPVMVSYLKKQNLATKKLFVIGMTPLKDAFRNNGFEVAENGPDRINESVGDFVSATIGDYKSISAIIIDIDFNVNYVNIQKAITLLRRSEVLFLKGATDMKGPAISDYIVAGPGYFQQIVEDMVGRKAVPMAKPSPFLHKYVVEKYGIKDVSRVLFVGDAVPTEFPGGLGYVFVGPGYVQQMVEDISGRKGIPMAKPSPFLHKHIVEKFGIEDVSRVLFVGDGIPTDMGFAAESGYKKLLVFSGLTKKEEVDSWKFPEEWKPDYYADSLKCVHDLALSLSAGQEMEEEEEEVKLG